MPATIVFLPSRRMLIILAQVGNEKIFVTEDGEDQDGAGSSRFQTQSFSLLSPVASRLSPCPGSPTQSPGSLGSSPSRPSLGQQIARWARLVPGKLTSSSGAAQKHDTMLPVHAAAMLSGPNMVTLLGSVENDGSPLSVVLCQNKRSRAYYGDLCPSTMSSSASFEGLQQSALSIGLLRSLFSLEGQDLMKELMAAMQVPEHCRQNHRPIYCDRHVVHPPHKLVSQATNPDEDEDEPIFQRVMRVPQSKAHERIPVIKVFIRKDVGRGGGQGSDSRCIFIFRKAKEYHFILSSMTLHSTHLFF